MKNIESLRKEIDLLHRDLFSLLEKRRELTTQVWEIKQQQGLNFFSPDREQQIIQDFVALNKNQDPEFNTLLENLMNHVLREYQTYLQAKFKK